MEETMADQKLQRVIPVVGPAGILLVALVTGASPLGAQQCGFCGNVPAMTCPDTVGAPCHIWHDAEPEEQGTNPRGDDDHVLASGNHYGGGTCGAEHPEPCVPPFALAESKTWQFILAMAASNAALPLESMAHDSRLILEFNPARSAWQLLAACARDGTEIVVAHLFVQTPILNSLATRGASANKPRMEQVRRGWSRFGLE
jgi:hypothetical protein